MGVREMLKVEGIYQFKRKSIKKKTELIRKLLAEKRSELEKLNTQRKEINRKIIKKSDVTQEVIDILQSKDFDKFAKDFDRYLK